MPKNLFSVIRHKSGYDRDTAKLIMDGPDSVVVHRPSRSIISLNKIDDKNGDVRQKKGSIKKRCETRNKIDDTEFLEAIKKLNHFCDIIELILCGLVDYIGEFRNNNHRYAEYDEALGENDDEISKSSSFIDQRMYPVFYNLYKESFPFYEKLKHEPYSMVYSFNPKDIISEELMDRALFHLKEPPQKEYVLEIKKFYARALTLSICLEKLNYFNSLQNTQISPYFSRGVLLFKKDTIEKKLEENYYLDADEKAQLKRWAKQMIDFVDTTSPIIMKHKTMPVVQSNFYVLSVNCLYESTNEDWYGKHGTIDLTNFEHCFHKYTKRPAIGWTILHEIAFFGGITESVLTKQKAIINAMDYHGYTPIFYTTFFDHVESFKLIWKHHLCRKNQMSFKGETILMVALKHRAIKCVEFLLNKQNHSSDAETLRNWEWIKLMISLQDAEQNLPLHILFTFNSVHRMLDKAILEPAFTIFQQWTHPSNLILKNLDGWIPFQLALVLRERICPPEVQTEIVEECLKIVTDRKSDDEILERMLLSGVDVTIKYVADDIFNTLEGTHENNNAMHLAAASKNSYRLLILLLKYAANHKISRCIQDEENGNGMKPIDIAVRHAPIETIKLLLKHFVFYNYNYKDIFQDVEQIDIKCDCYKYKKRTKYDFVDGNIEIFRFPSGQLLEILGRPYPVREEILKNMLESVYMPLDYNSYDSGKTAFDQAAQNENKECVQMFLDHVAWRFVMIRRIFHKDANSPFILILENMPDLLPVIFDKCIIRCEECKDTVYDFSLFEDMFVSKDPYDIKGVDKKRISSSPFYGIYQKPHWLPVYNLCFEHIANEINIKNTPKICDFCIQRNQCSMCGKNAIEWDPSRILNDQKEFLNAEQREMLAKTEYEYIPSKWDKTRCGELRPNYEIEYVPTRENALKKLAENARDNETPLFSAILDHEICSSYVNYKWNKFSSWIYFFLVVGCNLIHAGYLTVTNYTIGPIYDQNGTNKIAKEGAENVCLFDKDSLFLMMANFCGVLMTFLIITKIWYNPKVSLANFGHIIKGFFYLIGLPIFTYYCEDLDPNLQRNLFIITNFISWMLFLYCARIVPFIGLGIIVVHSMIMKFFKFLLAVLLFFTPFDAAFYIMEPDWPSVLKIFTGGMKNSSAKTLFDNYKYMGLILMFYIVVCLAVTDMNEAIKIAKRNQLCLRIKTILWIERCIPLFLKRRITRGLLKKRSMPTQISTYIFFFVIVLPFGFIGFLFKQVS